MFKANNICSRKNNININNGPQHTRTHFLNNLLFCKIRSEQKRYRGLKLKPKLIYNVWKVNGMHPPIMSLWGHQQKVQQFFNFLTLQANMGEAEIFHFSESL